MAGFSHLFSRGQIGSLVLPNRLFQTAMGTNLANSDGTINDQIISFYEARAAGGAALVTMGAVGVSYPRGQVQANQVGISDDRFVPGLRRITDAVHRAGGRISAQLHHGGTSALFCEMLAGRPVLCPSLPLPSGGGGGGLMDVLFPEELAASPFSHGSGEPPQFREMDEDDIASLIGDFADAAARAVKAGFDAVEVHAGHSYIISSFLSPAENRRTDQYGGSAENRARLLKQVIEAIRERIGADFPVLCKLNAAEFYVENGTTLEDACYYAQVAEAAGADAITASASHNYSIPKALMSSYLPHEPGKLISYAAAIKKAVSIPVVTAGRIDPKVADRAIARGQFDFMAMGRKQIADDAFSKHLSTGGKDAVRPCIYCYTCFSQAMLHQPLRCAVNGDVGFEKDNLLAPADRPRQVVVVGGGPAGMEAARRLALRGHSVILLESASRLGGTARIAAITYAPNGDFVEWLKRQLSELKVDVRLNFTATLENIRELQPDAVVVATGAIRRAPDIEGRHLPHVHDGASLRTLLLGEKSEQSEVGAPVPLTQRLAVGAARALGVTGSPEALRKASHLWMPVGDRVAIIGGDLVGLELAEFLHARGRRIGVVDTGTPLGRGLSPARRAVLLAEMEETDIALYPGASQIRIEASEVQFIDRHSEPASIAADTVIIAKGAHANLALAETLRAAGLEVYHAGDCSGVGYIQGAVRDATDVAAQI